MPVLLLSRAALPARSRISAATYLVIMNCIARELENLGSKVFEDGSEVS